jgi:retinol dehydrogenase 14
MEWYYVLVIVLACIICLCGYKRWMDGPANTFKPDLVDKVIIVTGANTGIGLTAALEMAKLKPKMLILGCRDPKRGADALFKITEESGIASTNIRLMSLDLADLESVKSFSKAIIDEFDQLDILLNNAGTFGLPERTTTPQGHEFTLGVNHLGHFLLT